jgi:hypothetical protein
VYDRSRDFPAQSIGLGTALASPIASASFGKIVMRSYPMLFA